MIRSLNETLLPHQFSEAILSFHEQMAADDMPEGERE
jgi:hypothetical protein